MYHWQQEGQVVVRYAPCVGLRVCKNKVNSALGVVRFVLHLSHCSPCSYRERLCSCLVGDREVNWEKEGVREKAGWRWLPVTHPFLILGQEVNFVLTMAANGSNEKIRNLLPEPSKYIACFLVGNDTARITYPPGNFFLKICSSLVRVVSPLLLQL